MRTRRFFARIPVVPALVCAAVACGDTSTLPPPAIANVEDTISLFALDGTPVSSPSGFNLATAEVVRTDRFASFDIAFNITPAGQAVLLPTGAMGLGRASGLRSVTSTFEDVKTAPTGTYTDSLPFPVDVGAVAVMRSRPTTCVFGTVVVFYYGKLQVLQIDTGARRIDLRILTDRNCGYRDLEPGLPRQ